MSEWVKIRDGKFYHSEIEASDIVGVGRNLYVDVYNDTGSTISKGKVVAPTGLFNGMPTVDLAIATKRAETYVVGFVVEDIPNNSSGIVQVFGKFVGLDTTAFSTNDRAFLSDTNAGEIQNTETFGGSFITFLGQITEIDATNGAIIIDRFPSELTTETKDYSGFVESQRSNLLMSVNYATRVFTISLISGSDWYYYHNGLKYDVTGSKSVTFSDIEGEHWIYLDGDSLLSIANPTTTQKDNITKNKVEVASFYWNATANRVEYDIIEQRHNIFPDRSSRLYLERANGSVYSYGLKLANFDIDGIGNLDSHAQFSVTTGRFLKIDLEFDVIGTNVGDTIEVAYLSGNNLNRVGSQTGVAFLNAPGGRVYYNQLVGSSWQLTEVGNNNYVLYHIFAVGGQTKRLVSVMGENQYATKQLAYEGSLTEIIDIEGNFKADTALALGTIIIHTKDSFSNSYKAVIVSTEDGEDYIDWTVSQQIGTGSSVTSHLQLTDIGINTHDQIDTHIADSTIHFEESDISHLNIQNIGTNTHTQIDSHIADNDIHVSGTGTNGQWLQLVSGSPTWSDLPNLEHVPQGVAFISPSWSPSASDPFFTTLEDADNAGYSNWIIYPGDYTPATTPYDFGGKKIFAYPGVYINDTEIRIQQYCEIKGSMIIDNQFIGAALNIQAPCNLELQDTLNGDIDFTNNCQTVSIKARYLQGVLNFGNNTGYTININCQHFNKINAKTDPSSTDTLTVLVKTVSFNQITGDQLGTKVVVEFIESVSTPATDNFFAISSNQAEIILKHGELIKPLETREHALVFDNGRIRLENVTLRHIADVACLLYEGDGVYITDNCTLITPHTESVSNPAGGAADLHNWGSVSNAGIDPSVTQLVENVLVAGQVI